MPLFYLWWTYLDSILGTTYWGFVALNGVVPEWMYMKSFALLSSQVLLYGRLEKRTRWLLSLYLRLPVFVQDLTENYFSQLFLSIAIDFSYNAFDFSVLWKHCLHAYWSQWMKDQELSGSKQLLSSSSVSLNITRLIFQVYNWVVLGEGGEGVLLY